MRPTNKPRVCRVKCALSEADRASAKKQTAGVTVALEASCAFRTNQRAFYPSGRVNERENERTPGSNNLYVCACREPGRGKDNNDNRVNERAERSSRVVRSCYNSFAALSFSSFLLSRVSVCVCVCGCMCVYVCINPKEEEEEEEEKRKKRKEKK